MPRDKRKTCVATESSYAESDLQEDVDYSKSVAPFNISQEEVDVNPKEIADTYVFPAYNATFGFLNGTRLYGGPQSVIC